MHILLGQHLKDIRDSYEYESETESKLFEYFCNYCVVSRHYLGRFDPKAVTTREDDASLDGIAIVVDGDLIFTLDDAEEIFKTHKSSLQVDIVFSQAKSGEKFDKAEIANFSLGLNDFLSLQPKLPSGEYNQNCLAIVRYILSNSKKLKNKRPNVHIYYCTSGVYSAEAEIDAAFSILKKQVQESDLFHEVSLKPAGRSELLSFWNDVDEKNEATLELSEYFGMPRMPDIPQSYIALVSAKKFVDSVLTKDGELIPGIFDENIRAYLGDGDVNDGIADTLRSGKKVLFPVLNNGVTIVSPDITLTANTKTIELSNYQIINGCQTSNTLFKYKEELNDDIKLVVKFVETQQGDASTDIIAATNSQNNIPKEQFLALRNKAKLVQKYFNAKNDVVSQDSRVYFERRANEYKGQLQASRVFDVREVSRSYLAMFLDQPHTSARYVTKIFSGGAVGIFDEADRECLYYCAVLASYKYNIMINGRKNNAHEFNKLRWHVLMLFKWVVHGHVNSIKPNQSAAESYVSKIMAVLLSEGKKYSEAFAKCHDIIRSIPFPSDDEIKRGRYASDLRKAADQYLKSLPHKIVG